MLGILLTQLTASAQIGLRPGIGRKQIALSAASMAQTNVATSALPKCPLRLTCVPINSCPVYVFLGTGDWRLPQNWENQQMPPGELPGCYQIIINPTGSSVCILPQPQKVLAGSQFVVLPGKTLIVPGKLTIE